MIYEKAGMKRSNTEIDKLLNEQKNIMQRRVKMLLISIPLAIVFIPLHVYALYLNYPIIQNPDSERFCSSLLVCVLVLVSLIFWGFMFGVMHDTFSLYKSVKELIKYRKRKRIIKDALDKMYSN